MSVVRRGVYYRYFSSCLKELNGGRLDASTHERGNGLLRLECFMIGVFGREFLSKIATWHQSK